MKKIKSKKHLLAEQRRLRFRREELERKLYFQWNELKDGLRPINIAKDTFSSFMNRKAAENLVDENILKSTLNYGISLLVKKLTDKAGKKFESLFRKNGKE